MGGIRTFLALAVVSALVCAGCTSSSDGAVHQSSSQTMTAPHTTAPPQSSSSTFTGPPRPKGPTIPADVPRTGPNTKPGEKPPLMPLEATQHTPEGAKAFAEFFIRTIDWGYATTSSAYMKHYYEKQCATCIAFQQTIDRDRAAGRHYNGGRLQVGDATSVNASGDVTRVVVPAPGTARVIITRTGNEIKPDPAYPRLEFAVRVKWGRVQWDVVNLSVVL